jgi:uncharacterized protein YjbI with pentapeptide repeats
MSKYTTRQILDMIEANGGPEGLDLSEEDLRGINLSRDTIQAELTRVREEDTTAKPVWVSDLTNGINLEEADLRGADLGGANLQEADLWRANLQEANLRVAKLQKADMGEAVLQRVDLMGANLQGADLGGADLHGADMWGADLQRANLVGVDLQKANLRGANLQGADLSVAKLQEASLRGARLQEVDVGEANFQKADLMGANLTRVDLLSAASIEQIGLYRAILDHTQLAKDQLGDALRDELGGEWSWAREAYRALKNNFDQIRRYEDATWAYRKERRMEKLGAWQRAQETQKGHRWKEAASNYIKVAGDQMVELLCDYGASIGRVLASLGIVWVLFALVYGIVGGVRGTWQGSANLGIQPTRYITRCPANLLVFSLSTMTAIQPAGLEADPSGWMRFFMPIQTAMGIALFGLLGFVAGHRIRRS